MLNEIIKVNWKFEGKKFNGEIEFKQEGIDEIFITVTNENNQVIENGTVDKETAEDIKIQIIDMNYDVTDFEIF